MFNTIQRHGGILKMRKLLIKKRLLLRDLDSSLLLERGELLGWEGATPVDLLAEIETTRLIISRYSPFCCVCGGGNFRYMLHLGDKNVCERCASEVSRILADFYRQPQ